MSSPAAPNPLHTAMRMLLRAIDAPDWAVVEALLHPQSEYEVTGYLPFRGRDAVMNYYRHVRPIRRGEHVVEHMIADETTGACWGRFNATRTDGTEVSLLFADVMTFEGRKIRRRRVYYCEPGAAGG